MRSGSWPCPELEKFSHQACYGFAISVRREAGVWGAERARPPQSQAQDCRAPRFSPKQLVQSKRSTLKCPQKNETSFTQNLNEP